MIGWKMVLSATDYTVADSEAIMGSAFKSELRWEDSCAVDRHGFEVHSKRKYRQLVQVGLSSINLLSNSTMYFVPSNAHMSPGATEPSICELSGCSIAGSFPPRG